MAVTTTGSVPSGADQILVRGADESRTGTPLLVVGNTTSGSVTILRFAGTGDWRRPR
jgi:hypothetical protein